LSNIDRIDLIDLYRKLFLTRHYDETLRKLAEEDVWNFYHGIIGEEAVPVGVCTNLREDDYVIPVHRTQMGAMIAKGTSLEKLTAELFGRSTGHCHGVAGTHIGCAETGILGKTGILGAGLPIAVGVGLSIKLRKTDQVVAVFFGDGLSSEGNFHESLNMASIWKLPVIFVLENNLYALTTPAKEVISVENLAIRARGYDIPGVTLDGNDVVKIYNASKDAVDRARNGMGPTLIECKTYRILGHSGTGLDEDAGYRTLEEVETWRKKDPVKLFREKLLREEILSKEEAIEIEFEARIAIESAVKFALESPFPTREEVMGLSVREGVK